MPRYDVGFVLLKLFLGGGKRFFNGVGRVLKALELAVQAIIGIAHVLDGFVL